MPSLKTEDSRKGAIARYAAGKVGLIATRPRGRRAPGLPAGFCVLDQSGLCVAGEGYTMSAEEVIKFCERIP